MMSLTDFLSCTDLIDQFDSLSYHQRRHAKAYVAGLITSGTKRSKASLGKNSHDYMALNCRNSHTVHAISQTTIAY